MSMRQSMVAMLFALLAIPTIASAHGGVPYSTSNVIHGCRNANGVLRQITSGGCAGDVVVHWNITGPAGPIGPEGPQGPAGATGATGANGTNATRPDPPCFLDNTNRYFDCGNGTVTDTVTGLIWLKQADCLANDDWAAANGAAAGLKDGDCGGNLTDNSSPGDWRLPTRDEWSATIAHAVALECTGDSGPSLTKNAGTTCFGDGTGSSFAGVASGSYWSSSTFESIPAGAWGAALVSGNVGIGNKEISPLRVWPVRGGPR